MALKFCKRIRVFPGFYLNLSKSGMSATVGMKGLNVNIGKKGLISTQVSLEQAFMIEFDWMEKKGA